MDRKEIKIEKPFSEVIGQLLQYHLENGQLPHVEYILDLIKKEKENDSN